MPSKDATETVPADAAGIARATEILRGGGLVAVPTETVYGLAARADSAEAVARIYEAKGRPSFNPLIVHIAKIEDLGRFTDPDRPIAAFGGKENTRLRDFAEQSWPGPVTLVVPCLPYAPVAPTVTAGLPTIALRIPKHRVARNLTAEVGPLAMPSANRSGFISPTTAEHVLASLDGRIDLVLDAGPTEAGVESTILKLRKDGRFEELRPGPEDTSLWHPNWFSKSSAPATGKIEAPGQLSRHYAPGKPVRLDAKQAKPDEFLIGFGEIEGEYQLSSGSLEQAAANLYAALHIAAQSGKPKIAVAPIPGTGIGVAINDRLRRAAA